MQGSISKNSVLGSTVVKRPLLAMLMMMVLLGNGCRKPKEDTATPSVPFIGNQLGIQHIVFISIDTLRADYLSCYGHPFLKSPTIDKLAADGVRFTQHMAASPTTLSSHTTMMTGMYPHTHGIARNGFHLSNDNLMLAEILKEAGFVTAGFIGAIPLSENTNFHQGFDHYNTPLRGEETGRAVVPQRLAEDVTDSVLDWLDATDRVAVKNLFLFVHYYDPHWPYTPPAPYARMYREDSLEIDGSLPNITQARQLLPLKVRFREFRPKVTRSESLAFASDRWERGVHLVDILAREYAAEITYCDHHVGRLLEGLRARGLWDDALIILTSDHGETMHEHANIFNHGKSVYDTEIHVPLIFVFPNGRYSGEQVDRLSSHVDLLPTLLDLLGLAPHTSIEGVSFSDVFRGRMDPREPVFAEATQPKLVTRFNDDPMWLNRGKFHCIRTERYKYMFRLPDKQFRLYDLVADPGEQHNLLDPEYATDDALVSDFDARLRAWRDDANPLKFKKIADPAHLDALRSLGYVGDDEGSAEVDHRVQTSKD